MSIILILATIFSPLDYCNSLLTGSPTSTLILLRSIMNIATRMKMWYHKADHITSWIKTLRRLSIFLRIKVKNFIMFTLSQLHLLLCCSWITLCTLQPQGFCTCSSLYMECSRFCENARSLLKYYLPRGPFLTSLSHWYFLSSSLLYFSSWLLAPSKILYTLYIYVSVCP